MKILILEDEEARVKHFRRKFKDAEISVVEHAEDAIKLLRTKPFDLICLDHDLGGTQMDFDPEDCGYLVAEHIAKAGIKIPVIIHSFNGPASKRMMQLLPEARYIPGFWL